jgi:hypothetical protein
VWSFNLGDWYYNGRNAQRRDTVQLDCHALANRLLEMEDMK